MSELWFRLLLMLYPARIRRRFGAEMLDYMRATRGRAPHDGGVVRFWWRLTIDTLRSLPSAWSRQVTTVASLAAGDRDSLLRSFGTDVRLAIRSLARHPGFAAAVVLTLALGIGASTAVFSVVDGVLLAPLPYPDADRLVGLSQQNAAGMRFGLSVADFQAIHEQQRSFDAVAVMASRDMILAADGEPAWTRVTFVSADFFRVLDLQPARGRALRAGDDAVGAEQVVVLGHAAAQRLFGGADPIGRPVRLDETAYTVVGVMPEGIEELAGWRADLWPVMQLETPGRRGPFFLRGIGRLRGDRSLDDASADLAAISTRIFPIWAAGFRDETARFTPIPLREIIVGNVGGRLQLIFVAVMLVLLVAVANVGNLILARTSERRAEVALRSALGAGAGRLLRWMLAESLVLATAGAALGLALAGVALSALRSLGPSLPRIAEVGLKSSTVAFAAAVAIVVTLLLGLAPALATGAQDLSRSLREGARAAISGNRARTVRNALVVLELAVTVPLLLAAGLLLNSLWRMQQVDPGFDPRNTFAIRVGLPPATYPDAEAHAQFWRQAIEAVGQVPGVAAAGAAHVLPPDSFGFNNNFDLVDRPVDAGQPEPVAPWVMVTGPFLEALGVPLLEGRLLTEEDFAGTGDPVAVASLAWARRYFPDESAVGKRIYSGGDRDNPLTIVGVVGDVKYEGLVGAGEAVYEPGGGGWLRSLNLLVRTDRDPASVLPAARERLGRIDAGLPLTDVVTLEERLAASVAAPRQWALLLATFACTATVLSAVGIFGVVAHAVRGQTREIGVRMALGATASGVVASVVGRAMARVGIGLALGLGAAAFTMRWLESFLFGVSPGNPLNVLVVCLLLGAVGLVASWIPSRGAARIDPIAALSSD